MSAGSIEERKMAFKRADIYVRTCLFCSGVPLDVDSFGLSAVSKCPMRLPTTAGRVDKSGSTSERSHCRIAAQCLSLSNHRVRLHRSKPLIHPRPHPAVSLQRRQLVPPRSTALSLVPPNSLCSRRFRLTSKDQALNQAHRQAHSQAASSKAKQRCPRNSTGLRMAVRQIRR